MEYLLLAVGLITILVIIALSTFIVSGIMSDRMWKEHRKEMSKLRAEHDEKMEEIYRKYGYRR